MSRDDPYRYVKHVLKSRVKVSFIETPNIPIKRWPVAEGIVLDNLEKKEKQRWKAKFRDQNEMKTRITNDLAMSMLMARSLDEDSIDDPQGYVLSDDVAFRLYQQHPSWAPRKRVHLYSRSVANLAEFTAGITFLMINLCNCFLTQFMEQPLSNSRQ